METVGRVFLAVRVPSDVRAALAAHMASLEIPGRLVPAENWHLTARFLGTVDEITYDRFLGELAQADLPDAFPVRLGRIGGFPNSKRANVVWVGVERGDQQMPSSMRSQKRLRSQSAWRPRIDLFTRI